MVKMSFMDPHGGLNNKMSTKVQPERVLAQ